MKVKKLFLKKYKHATTNSLVKLFLSMTTAAVAFILLVGGSYGWYINNQNVDADQAGIDSAESEGTLEVGHDTYKFDVENNYGYLNHDDTIVMNQYDKVFTAQNEYTPIILRAVLDPKWEEQAVDGKVKLVLSCGSDSLYRDGYDRDGDKEKDSNDALDMKRDEEGKLSESGKTDNIIDYLSNVVNFRAAYIPGLADNALEDNFDTDIYHDADDYIYQYAVDYFKGNDIKCVDFWNKITNEIDERTESTTTTKFLITKVNNVSDITTVSRRDNEYSEDNLICTSYTFDKQPLGFMIGGDNSLFMDDNLSGTTYSVSSDLIDAQPNESILWTITGENSSIQNMYTKKYLTANRSGSWYNYKYTLSTSDNASAWTIKNGMSFNQNSSYLRQNGDKFDAQGNTTNLNLYKVEKVTVKTETTIPATTTTTYDKKVTIVVDLNQARADNGYYYVYLMIDYDEDLIKKYLALNGMRWTLKSGLGNSYGDNFSITVANQ